MGREKKSRIFIEPPRLKWEFIREKAEDFRKKYVENTHHVPVPIIEIVELKLGIEPIPIDGLMNRVDIDGFLTNDLKNICVDSDIYLSDKQKNRLRFTYAHEVGHLVLHEKEIRECDFRTSEEWIHFREDFLEDDLNWFEQQAYEFAGRLLVPKAELLGEVQKYREPIKKFISKYGAGKEELIEAISRSMCKKFEVSWIVIQKRIRIEKIKL